MQSDLEDPALIKFRPEFLQNRFKEITSALSDPDFETMRKLSHNWKGFSRPYGFIELESIAHHLGQKAKSKDLSACIEILEKAKSYCLEQQKKLENT